MAKIDERALALGTLILNSSFQTTIAKTKTFNIRMEDMPDNAILTLLAHGVQRKFNDAVGGSDKTAATKVELAEKMIEDYKNGITGRVAAAKVPELTVAIRAVIRRLLDKDTKKALGELEADARNAKLDEIFAKQSDAKQAAITALAEKDIEEAKRRAAEAAQLAGEVGGLEL